MSVRQILLDESQLTLISFLNGTHRRWRFEPEEGPGEIFELARPGPSDGEIRQRDTNDE